MEIQSTSPNDKFEHIFNKTRLNILFSLAFGKKTMKEIASSLGLTVVRVSQELKLLESLGVISKHKEKGNSKKISYVYSINFNFLLSFAFGPNISMKTLTSLDCSGALFLYFSTLNKDKKFSFLQNYMFFQQLFSTEYLSIFEIYKDDDKLELLILFPAHSSLAKQIEHRLDLEGNIVVWSYSYEFFSEKLLEGNLHFKGLAEVAKPIWVSIKLSDFEDLKRSLLKGK